MEEKLRIALVQTTLVWQDAKKNRIAFQKLLEQIDSKTDLVILPEMFTTGFTMEAQKVAENMDGLTVNWMQMIAKTYNTAVTGSIIIREKNTFYNRLIFVHPDGRVQHYDKRHLFVLAKEDQYFSPGVEPLCITYKGWRIKPLVCYDLRFPVWSRNIDNYDLLFYVANWPKPRIHAWDTLLQARAIENVCFVAGVNRIGVDDEGHQYIGHSAVYDMLGKGLTPKGEEHERIIYADLDKSMLNTVRERFPFLEDRDSFEFT